MTCGVQPGRCQIRNNGGPFGPLFSYDEAMTGNDTRQEKVDPESLIEQILADPEMTQHIIRSGPPESESQVSYFRCSFEPGRQRFALHVPLSPPLQSVPEVQTMVMDCDQARIRITDREKFGVRAEIILDQPAVSARQILVEIITYTESL